MEEYKVPPQSYWNRPLIDPKKHSGYVVIIRKPTANELKVVKDMFALQSEG